jgi:hypothetical protein
VRFVEFYKAALGVIVDLFYSFLCMRIFNLFLFVVLVVECMRKRGYYKVTLMCMAVGFSG